MILLGSIKKAASVDLKSLSDKELYDHSIFLAKKSYSCLWFMTPSWSLLARRAYDEQILRIEELRKENRELLSDLEKRLSPTLVGLNVNEKSAEVKFKLAKDVMVSFAAHFTTMLEGAENYVEVDIVDPAVNQHYTLLIQRKAKKTPHQLRKEFENQVNSLVEYFDLHDQGDHWTTCAGDCGCSCHISPPCSHCVSHKISKEV